MRSQLYPFCLRLLNPSLHGLYTFIRQASTLFCSTQNNVLQNCTKKICDTARRRKVNRVNARNHCTCSTYIFIFIMVPLKTHYIFVYLLLMLLIYNNYKNAADTQTKQYLRTEIAAFFLSLCIFSGLPRRPDALPEANFHSNLIKQSVLVLLTHKTYLELSTI